MSRAAPRPKYAPVCGRMPVLQFCRPEELRVDPAYQRNIGNGSSQTLIRRIAANWNWDLCQPLVVARRTDFIDRLFVIDGQHRLEAARIRGDIAQLPCVIVAFDSTAAEAASFVSINQQRKPLSKVELFKAAIASGEPTANAVGEAMLHAGLSLATNSNYTAWKPGEVVNIAGIQTAWRVHGPKTAALAMSVLVQAFPGERLQYAGTIFPGILKVCATEGDLSGAQLNAFCELLRVRTQKGWYGDIAKLRVDFPNYTHASGSAKVVLDAWNLTKAALVMAQAKAATAPPFLAAPVAPKPAIAVQVALSPPRPAPRPAPPRAPAPPSEPKRAPVTALTPKRQSQFIADAEGKSHCDQCDSRVTRARAQNCTSRFCKVKPA